MKRDPRRFLRLRADNARLRREQPPRERLQRLGEPGDLFRLMARAQRDAEAGGAAGDGRMPDGGDEKPCLGESGGDVERGRFVADDPREDRAFRGRLPGRCAGGGGELRGEVANVLPEGQAKALALIRVENLQRGDGRSRQRGRLRRGKDEAAGAVDEQIDQRAAAGEIAAGDAEGLAHCPHEDVDLPLTITLVRQPAAVGPDDPEGVGFIDEQQRAVSLLQRDKIAERGAIAVHAEDRLRQDEGASFGMLGLRPLEQRFKFPEVVVGEDPDHGLAPARGIDEAGVGELVQNEDIAFAGEGADRPVGRGVPAGEREGGLDVFEAGEALLELQMGAERSADEAGGARADAELIDRPLRGLAQGRVRREAEVVVGGEVDHRSARRGDRAIRTDHHFAEAAVERLRAEVAELVVEGIGGHGRQATTRIWTHKRAKRSCKKSGRVNDRVSHPYIMLRRSRSAFLLPLLTVTALLGFSMPARAEDGEIIKELSVTNTEKILEALKLEYDEIAQGTYRFKFAGYKVLLFNKGKNLQFYASFKRKTTLGRINEWNLGKRYTRAYLDKDGDPCLEADLDLEGGVSYGAVAEFFKTWQASVKLFVEHIGFK